MYAIRLLAKISITLPAALLLAQSNAPTFKPSFTIWIAPEREKVELGNKVKIKAAIASTADITELPGETAVGCTLYRVHVKTQNGEEPEKTEFYRHLLGEFLPGDGPDFSGGSCSGQILRAGGTVTKTYDLSSYYKLAIPGKYDVTIDIDEEIPNPSRPSYPASYTVHSNLAHFELVEKK